MVFWPSESRSDLAMFGPFVHAQCQHHVIGVLEYWGVGVLGDNEIIRFTRFNYSITPVLQHSLTPKSLSPP